jgi:hypothetical protein
MAKRKQRPETRVATLLEEEVLTLRGKVRALKQELKENQDLRERMTKILNETANALHGGPLKNGLWSWHDLAELAATQRRALETAAHALRSYEAGNDAKELAHEVATHCEKVLNAASQEAQQIAAWSEAAREEKP